MAIAPTIMDNVYAMEQESKIDDAILYLGEFVDTMFKHGHFDEVDKWLADAKNKRHDTNVLLCFLVVTLPAKSKLKERAGFYEWFEKELTRRDGKVLHKEMLVGLK